MREPTYDANAAPATTQSAAAEIQSASMIASESINQSLQTVRARPKRWACLEGFTLAASTSGEVAEWLKALAC
jgi:hypothetical protein